MRHEFISNGGSDSITFSFDGEYGVRRIVLSSDSDTPSLLTVNGGVGVLFFNKNNTVELKFESYYGFPIAKKIGLLIPPKSRTTVMIDDTPQSSVNDSYFIREV